MIENINFSKTEKFQCSWENNWWKLLVAWSRAVEGKVMAYGRSSHQQNSVRSDRKWKRAEKSSEKNQEITGRW